MPSFARTLETWNRRLHYYLGLYFLFFLWLFSLTGLMLNHQDWFTDLYDRHQVTYYPPITTPAGETRTEQTLDLMRQLNLRGEVDWPASQPVGHIDFTVARPNGAVQVRADLNAKQAYVKEFQNSTLHGFQVLHTFSGTRFNQPESRRDWVVTTAWVFAMDALAAGLIVMVIGSYYMWWRLKKEKAPGVVALALGCAACAAFTMGLL